MFDKALYQTYEKKNDIYLKGIILVFFLLASKSRSAQKSLFRLLSSPFSSLEISRFYVLRDVCVRVFFFARIFQSAFLWNIQLTVCKVYRILQESNHISKEEEEDQGQSRQIIFRHKANNSLFFGFSVEHNLFFRHHNYASYLVSRRQLSLAKLIIVCRYCFVLFSLFSHLISNFRKNLNTFSNSF